MAQCRECSRAGWWVWINGRGVCSPCDRDLRSRAEAQRERVKEALIFARVLRSPRDRSFHLLRARDGVRVLSRYEEQGCGEIHPRPADLLKVIEGKLEELRDEHGLPLAAGAPGEWKVAGTRGIGGDGEFSESMSTRGVEGDPEPWERRRSPRRSAGSVGQVRVAGVRARAEDVSAGGVRVRSPFVRRAGSRVELSFQTPGGRVMTQALVRWALPLRAAAGGKGEMGLELLGVEDPLKGSLGAESAA